jgi:hypothetical protein
MMIGTREPVSKQAIFYRSQVVYTAAICASGLGPKRHRLWQQTIETLLFSRARREPPRARRDLYHKQLSELNGICHDSAD